MSELIFGVAIPAYRNIEGLRRCLKSIERASPLLAAHISVTDDSGDGRIANALSAEFPSVNWVVHGHNRGFGPSGNDAVTACKADIVILLNDDVELTTDPVPPLRKAFMNPGLFAVTFQSQHADGTFREGAKRLVWRMGMPRILHNPQDQLPAMKDILPSSYAVGGHAAFQRSRFLTLRGFDKLFEPFYWEDVDLSARARLKGWTIAYLPECEVKHDGESAIRSSHDAQLIRETTLRNRLLFAWRHGSRCQRIVRTVSLGYRLTLSAFTRRRTWLHAWSAARLRRTQSAFPPLRSD
jgi:GT2 family glycosyltransferase